MNCELTIVIADDITGAAEIAGIAHSYGLNTKLAVQPAVSLTPCDVLVIATDTRSMSEDEAVSTTQELARAIKQEAPTATVFKKTDSALRGHVVAELRALMQGLGCHRCVYMPANPSKGRIIKDGVYYINGKPIAETDFSFDPEFPALTSTLAERFPQAEVVGIQMPDATCPADLQTIVATTPASTILAGAADLFTAFLLHSSQFTVHSSQFTATQPDVQSSMFNVQSSLILCGSTQSHPQALGIAVSPMPLAVYDGSSDLSEWLTDGGRLYQDTTSLMLTIPHHHRTGKAVAVHLRQAMATMTAHLVALRQPRLLAIEGGATAFAVLQQLGWLSFTVTKQLAPGVVLLQASNGVLICLKPGSYPWGNIL